MPAVEPYKPTGHAVQMSEFARAYEPGGHSVLLEGA